MSGVTDYDVCVIGSGAGGGPVACTLAERGFSVVLLEKGAFYDERDFFKDEISVCRRKRFHPSLRDEPHVVVIPDGKGGTSAHPTHETGWDFWNGSLVGGATNLMSGFFHRLKPIDFRLASELGPIEGGDVADWPIGYDELEPWYDLVEREVGVSGRVVPHPWADSRSSADFPFAPTAEHPLARWIDDACAALGFHSFPVPRAILATPHAGRASCAYSGYCGSYGCSTGAKGSSRAALLGRALATGRCTLVPRAHVSRLRSDASGRVRYAEYRDDDLTLRRVDARVFVVACQAVESARLLLHSTGPRHPRGLANQSGLVGKNLIFSAAGSGHGNLPFAKQPPARAAELRSPAPFINRALQDCYLLDDGRGGRMKGGTIDFLLRHPNPIRAALAEASSADELLYGWPLKRRLERYFRDEAHVLFEAFLDWVPHPACHVTLDDGVRDRFGLPVARVRPEKHPHNERVAKLVVAEGNKVLERLGAERISLRATGGPATNLVGGTCRFGDDPGKSVLDRDCRAHDVENLFVTDGSFMPTGGSVPFTWTLYANAFRVADRIAAQLGAGMRARASPPTSTAQSAP